MTEGQVFQGRDARVPSGPWDVIVVGAGIYGLPVAFFLARRGVRVLVLEDNAIPGECITVNTGGMDHPVMEFIKVNLADSGDSTPFGYSGGTDPGSSLLNIMLHNIKTAF